MERGIEKVTATLSSSTPQTETALMDETRECWKYCDENFNKGNSLADDKLAPNWPKNFAEKKPYYVMFRCPSMVRYSVMTDFDQIFISLIPAKVKKVL